MFARPIQENLWRENLGVLPAERAVYPVWIDFLTFSTGFSTGFVKKKRVFPQCFPLFPPSFPQKIERRVIRDVFSNGKRGKNWGEKASKHLFSKRKSRPKIYFLRLFARGAKPPLHSGIFGGGVFHKYRPEKLPCGKPWENPSFPQFSHPEKKHKKKSASRADWPAEAHECRKNYTAP